MKKRASPPERTALPVRLAVLQRMMGGAVMAPMGARQRMRREHAAVASVLIKPNPRLSSLSRLEIYHQQYWWRLKSALIEDFPGLRSVLGVRRFDRLMDEYLATRGSTSWNLRDLGQHLAAFLRQRPELLEPHKTLALDMVRVEWARVIAFDGAEHPRFDSSLLTAARPEGLQIGLQPFVTLLAISYPVDRMLGRLKQGKVRFRRWRPLSSTIHLAIHRQEFAVYYRRLEPGEYLLLSSLHAGRSVEAACAEASEQTGEFRPRFALKIQRWFAQWMQLGWLCAVPRGRTR